MIARAEASALRAPDPCHGLPGDPGRPGVGIANARVAFFMGHTELLGLGAGTATSHGASLSGTASYDPAHAADERPGRVCHPT